MGINRDFRDLFSELNATDARFLVIGAHAVMFHAVPRYTKDLDVWTEPSAVNAQRVYAALACFGAPMETLTPEDLATPGTIFQIGVEPNRIDVVTAVDGLRFADAWATRVASTYGEVPISILGLDDLLRNKRAVARPQDLLDVEWLERVKDQRDSEPTS